MNIKNFVFEAIKPAIEYLVNHPDVMGISSDEYSGMVPQQRTLFLEGEALFYLTREISVPASQRLFASQWGFSAPEWYDHRHSWLVLISGTTILLMLLYIMFCPDTSWWFNAFALLWRWIF